MTNVTHTAPISLPLLGGASAHFYPQDGLYNMTDMGHQEVLSSILGKMNPAEAIRLADSVLDEWIHGEDTGCMWAYDGVSVVEKDGQIWGCGRTSMLFAFYAFGGDLKYPAIDAYLTRTIEKEDK